MIKGNYSLLSKMPVRFLGGSTLAGDRSNFNKTAADRNSFVGAFPPQGGEPNGYSWPYAWNNSVKNGALATYTGVAGTSAIGSSLVVAKLSVANLSGTSTINASVNVLIELAAMLVGTGNVVAQVAAVSKMVAAITSSGTVSAGLSAAVQMISSASGVGAIDAVMRGFGSLSSDISPFTDLSPENLADAVWAYQKTDATTTGSMGVELKKAKTAAENAFAVSA
jgi:hypothetical protein